MGLDFSVIPPFYGTLLLGVLWTIAIVAGSFDLAACPPASHRRVSRTLAGPERLAASGHLAIRQQPEICQQMANARLMRTCSSRHSRRSFFFFVHI